MGTGPNKMPPTAAMRVSDGQMQMELAPAGTSKAVEALEEAHSALFKVCSVTRVDPKRMIVDLITLTGGTTPFKAVPLTFGSAGARTFCGVLPEVNDNCVIGFAPKESGRTRQPYIVGWLIPGTQVGYDWVAEQPASPLEQPSTKAMEDRLEGLFTRRRHKLHNFAPGNGVMSSAQGADLVLDESATLVNRRGNELVLRDQDQALVVRSLQQFHAGAGFRIYGGMVQRDATLLPTQMFADVTDWAAYGQLLEDGEPAPYGELTEGDPVGYFTPATLFRRDPETGDPLQPQIVSGNLNPFENLQRGKYLDDEGGPYDWMTTPSAVYGGKPIFRVAHQARGQNAAGENVVQNPALDAFAEYRIEVAHTSDGTLPVTEQTDGLDIDRMPDAVPTTGNALNSPEAAPMVELVMGTVVGNDPIGAREQYGLPLMAQVMEAGEFAPKIVSAQNAPEGEQLAFMIRVKNPEDPSAPPAFWGITKGGALKSYFPGHGSATAQEHYETGKTLHLGNTDDGTSFKVQASGVVSLTNETVARASDGVGAEMVASQAALRLHGGASINEGGNSAPPTDSDAAEAQSLEPAAAVKITSGVDTLIEAVNGKTFIRSPAIILDNAATITETASSDISMSSGDSMSLTSNALNVTVNGKSIHTYGGPKGSNPTAGALRETSFTGTPLTGCLGGAVDEQSIVYGGRSEEQTLGKRSIACTIGGIELMSMAGKYSSGIGPGTGVTVQCGPKGTNNSVKTGLTGAAMQTIIPGSSVGVKAIAGAATVMGSMGVNVQSAARIGMAAPLVAVNVVGLAGGVITDGCIDALTGLPFLASGTVGVPTFRVGG
jgi:hypothetical protein|tara:strand:+ start:527 stop:3013 length:2487 start_codon:yes stop_codon:yes gene_type:complete